MPVNSRLVALTAACLLLGTCAGSARAAGVPAVATEQQLVELLGPHLVRSAPRSGARLVASVRATRPITGARTVLPVLGQRVDGAGRFWLRVRLPGRTLRGGRPPRSGWISAAHTTLTTTSWRIVVDVRARRLSVYDGGALVRRLRAIVGRPSTPTPRGAFFVEESVRMPPGAPGAPYALALSARSNVLQEFAGGPGQIAVHGVANIGGALGSAVSHGCVRLAGQAVSWLAARMHPGVPVTIE